MPDIAIPIVFPDYLITVETPRALKVRTCCQKLTYYRTT